MNVAFVLGISYSDQPKSTAKKKLHYCHVRRITWMVIFGRDLIYDAGWRGNRKIPHDSVVKKAPEEEFTNLVKQTYRVLLTRGMKGCYMYFEDAATREFFLSRMKTERASAVIEV